MMRPILSLAALLLASSCLAAQEVPKLLEMVKTGSGYQFVSALEQLERLKVDLKPVLPDLVKRAKGKMAMDEAQALATVLAQHNMPEVVLPVRFLLLLEGHDNHTALTSTRFYVHKPELAMKALLPLINDPDLKVRARALRVFAVLDIPPSHNTPQQYVKSLQDLSVSSKDLLANLRANLKEKDREVRWYSAVALVLAKAADAKDLAPLAVAWLKQEAAPAPKSDFGAVRELSTYLLQTDSERALELVFDTVAASDDALRDRFAIATSKFPDPVLKAHLIKAFASQNPSQRSYGLAVVRRMVYYGGSRDLADKLSPQISKLLDDPQKNLQLAAAGQLVAMGAVEPDRILPVLVKFLADKETASRGQALYLLQLMGQKAAAARPALLLILNDPNAGLQLQAAATLIQLDPKKSAETLPILKQNLEKPNPVSIGQVLSLTVKLGSAAEPLLPALSALVEDKQGKYRLTAVEALLSVDPKRTEPALQAVMDALADPKTNPVNNFALVRAMRLLGPAAKPALPAVQKLYEKKKLEYHLEWVFTAAVIDPSDANPAMRFIRDAFAGKTKTNPEDLQLDLLDEMIQMGPSAKVFLPELITLIKSGDNTSGLSSAIRALGAIGPEAKEAVPHLEALAASTKSVGTKNQIKKALAKIAGK